MLQQILAAFPHADNCHEQHSNIELGIVNDVPQQKCRTKFQDQHTWHFIVNNPTEKTIHFIAIDHCVFNTNAVMKCDCVLFDNLVFRFIEIEGKSQRTRNHAKDQLESTIQQFKKAHFDYSGFHIEAIIAWQNLFPRPKVSTAMQSSVLHFQQSYQADLLEVKECNF